MSLESLANKFFSSKLIRKVLLSGFSRFFVLLGSIFFAFYLPIYYDLEALGIFTIALSYVIGLTLAPRFGFEKYILKISGSQSGRKNSLKSEVLSIMLAAALIAIIVIIITLLLINYLHAQDKNLYLGIFIFGVLPVTINMIFANYLNGIGRPELSVFFEPSAVSAACLIYLLGLTAFDVRTSFASLIYFWVGFAYFMMTIVILYFIAVKSTLKNIRPFATVNQMKGEGANYFLSGLSSYFLSMGLFPVLDLWLDNVQVGIYRLCERIVSMLSFILIIINNVFARNYSRLWSEARYKRLALAYFKSLQLGWLISLPVCLFIFYFSETILKNYLTVAGLDLGVLVLRIMLIGSFVNIAFGGVLLILNMTDHHQIARNISMFISVFGIALFYFMPKYQGIQGAAIAYLIFMLAFNLSGFIYVYKKVLKKRVIGHA